MVTEEEKQRLTHANVNWHVDRFRTEANAIFAKYNGRGVDLHCGGCLQQLRNWIIKQVHG